MYEGNLKAAPHNSPCRYGERGGPAAKQKAQRILCVFSSIFATQMVRRSRRSFGFWRVGPHLSASENGEHQMQAVRGLQPNERASFAGWRALSPPSGA